MRYHIIKDIRNHNLNKFNDFNLLYKLYYFYFEMFHFRINSEILEFIFVGNILIASSLRVFCVYILLKATMFLYEYVLFYLDFKDLMQLIQIFNISR